MAAGHEINLYYPEAAGGTFTVKLHGTGTLATVFSDYDCLSSTASRSISALGRAKCYAKVLVDVEVFNFAGVSVATRVMGTRGETVAIQSPAFTGTLDGGGTGASGSIYLDSLLDKWFTSADALDFEVKETGTGSSVPLKTALANLRSNNTNVFNVKSPPYNAVGDGATNDNAAVQAALTALVANGGGVLRFPAGEYLISGTLSAAFSGGIVIEGESQGTSSILSTNGSAAISLNVDRIVMQDISVESSSATAVLLSLNSPTSAVVRDCAFENTNAVTQVSLVGGSQMSFVGCSFSGDVTLPKFALSSAATSELTISGSHFFSPILAVTGGCAATVNICNNKITSNVAAALVQLTSVNAATFVTATGNVINPGGSSTAFISLTTSLAASIVESGNVVADDAGSFIDPLRLAGTSTGNIVSLSRKPNVSLSTGASGAPRVGADMTTVSANAGFTIGAPVHLDGTAVNPWHGAECAMQVHNSTGGAIAITLNAALHGSSLNLPAGNTRIYRWRYNNAGAVSGWLQVAAAQDQN